MQVVEQNVWNDPILSYNNSSYYLYISASYFKVKKALYYELQSPGSTETWQGAQMHELAVCAIRVHSRVKGIEEHMLSPL